MIDSELRSALGAWEAEEHPTEESWERFALDELEAAERESLLEHALVCGLCARTLRAVVALEELRPRRARVLGFRGDSASFLRLGLAAAAALVVAAGVWLTGGRFQVDPRELVRGAEVSTASEPISALFPVGRIASGPEAFRWRELEGAESYRVHLYSEDGLPLATAETDGTELRAERLSAHLAPGHFVWRVEALRAEIVVGSSRLVDFELRP